MELLADGVVRSRLGFLCEGREVDWPKVFPEPVAEAAEELCLSESDRQRAQTGRVCSYGSTHGYFILNRSAGLPRRGQRFADPIAPAPKRHAS